LGYGKFSKILVNARISISRKAQLNFMLVQRVVYNRVSGR
jgi:hypothetical protein